MGFHCGRWFSSRRRLDLVEDAGLALAVIDLEATGRSSRDGEAAGGEPFEEPLEPVADRSGRSWNSSRVACAAGPACELTRQVTCVPSELTWWARERAA